MIVHILNLLKLNFVQFGNKFNYFKIIYRFQNKIKDICEITLTINTSNN
jgi:hypothetical protein